MNEKILIVSETIQDGESFAKRIGVNRSDDSLLIVNKYYSAKVHLEFIPEQALESDEIRSKITFGGVVLVKCHPGSMIVLDRLDTLGDDAVKLFVTDTSFTDALNSTCIDEGFELVSCSDVDRVLEALACRAWKSCAPAIPVTEPVDPLTSLEALMSKMRSIREGNMSDTDRRRQAEALMSHLYDLIDNSDKEDEASSSDKDDEAWG